MNNLNTNLYDGFVVVDEKYRDARGRVLRVGETYEIDPDRNLIKNGFLVTKNPLKAGTHLLSYNRYLLVSIDGDVEPYGRSKFVASKIHVERELSLQETVYQMLDHSDDVTDDADPANGTRFVKLLTDNDKMISSPYLGSIAVTGGRSSAAYSYAGGSGAVTLGTDSYAISESVVGLAAALNSWSVAMCDNDDSVAVTTGSSSTAISRGNLSVAIATSSYTSQAIADTEGTIAIIPSCGVAFANAPGSVAIGEHARGVLGSWLVLLELAKDYDSDDSEIVNTKTIKIDGENFYEDIIYSLVGGDVIPGT